MAAAQGGDRSALDRLLRRHYDRVHAVCRRIAGSDPLAALGRRRRRPALHAVTDDAPASETPDPSAERLVEAVIDRASLDAALADLGDDFRIVVVLRDVADLDYAEIAEVLQIPVGTVKSRIARGRSQLAEALGNRDTLAGRPTNEPPVNPPNSAS